MRNVRDILLDRDMFFVEEHQTVAEVARQMADLRVGAILVLRNRELRGLFSERDLMTRVVVTGRDVRSTQVREVMTSQPTTISDEASIETAMETMHAIGCRHLPVVRHNQVLGMVSMRDLMDVELDRKTEEIRHMRAYIHGAS